MRLSGRYRKQFEQAERYEKLAVAALSRAGSSERWLADFHVLRLWYKCQIELSQKELKRAEQSCEESLRLAAKVPKMESSQHIGILISLANVYKRQEKSHQALAHYKQALSLGEKAYGAVHPNVAVNYYNIGSLLGAQQKYDEAGESLRKALDIYKRVFGAQHPRLFSVYAALTRNAYLQQRFDEAVAYAQGAQQLDPELSSATLHAAADCLLGDALYRQGRYDAALIEHQKAVERCDPRRCESEWPYFQIALADDLRALRRSKQALPLLEEALRLLPKAADYEVQARAQFSLAQALYDVKKQQGLARAEELATSALVLYRTAGRHTQSEQAAILAWLRRSRAEPLRPAAPAPEANPNRSP
jgi:tetratricopeptide (TPR) repeat protein